MWTVVFARRSPTASSGDHLSNSCARSERKRPATHSSTLITPGLIAQISHLRMLARTDTVRLKLEIDEHIGHLPSPRDREPAPCRPGHTERPHGRPPPTHPRTPPHPMARLRPTEADKARRQAGTPQPRTALQAPMKGLSSIVRNPTARASAHNRARRWGPCCSNRRLRTVFLRRATRDSAHYDGRGRRAGSDASVSHDAPASRQARSTAAPGHVLCANRCARRARCRNLPPMQAARAIEVLTELKDEARTGNGQRGQQTRPAARRVRATPEVDGGEDGPASTRPSCRGVVGIGGTLWGTP